MQLDKTRVKDIIFTLNSVAALTYDGDVITWGMWTKSSLKNVQKVYSNLSAFAAVTEEGNIITWGQDNAGGDNHEVNNLPKMKIKHIYSNDDSFAALLEGGNVITWDWDINGGKTFRRIEENITEIYANKFAFSGISADQRVISWGSNRCGGNCSFVKKHLVDVEQIFFNNWAFAALNKKQELIFWGQNYGYCQEFKDLYKKVHNQIDVNITNYVLGNESNIFKQFPQDFVDNYKDYSSEY